LLSLFSLQILKKNKKAGAELMTLFSYQVIYLEKFNNNIISNYKPANY